MKVPFVSFRPMEKELDAELRGAFERVFARSWYIEGQEDEAFEKAFAAQLELGSKWQLINSVDSYELEFRLVEGSNGRLKPLIGMRTLKDERFAYRKKSISTGMKPYLAALLVRLSSGFVKDNAVVMDMMCGSGIFLIEREMLRPCRMLYGIDIYGQAIDAARENIRAAGKERKTELITRDLHDFTFKHEVDEIYADTPAVSANRSAGELSGLIECFFKKSAQFLATDGHVFVYTHNAELIRSIAIKQGFVLTDSFEISKLEKSRYIVFSRARV